MENTHVLVIQKAVLNNLPITSVETMSKAEYDAKINRITLRFKSEGAIEEFIQEGYSLKWNDFEDWYNHLMVKHIDSNQFKTFIRMFNVQAFGVNYKFMNIGEGYAGISLEKSENVTKFEQAVAETAKSIDKALSIDPPKQEDDVQSDNSKTEGN